MQDDPRFNAQSQFPNPPIQAGPNTLTMTLEEKIKLAFSLTKSHALTLFLVMLVGWLALYILMFIGMLIFGLSPFLLGGSEPSGGSLAFMILGMLATGVVVIFLGQFFMIGVNALTLQYVDGERPPIISTVMSPWARFGTVVLCVLLWLILNIAFQIAAGVVSIIPILGWLAAFAGMIVFGMIMICALFYMADREEVRPLESVELPIKMVFSSFMTWLVAVVVSLVAYIPVGIIIFVVLLVVGAMGSTVLLFLASLFVLACIVAVSVFNIFVMALTYRQTRGGFIAATNVFN